MKIEPIDLFHMANHAEDVAEVSRKANQNEYGFWHRLVNALEDIAYDTNGTRRWEGWLVQFARASETIADFFSQPGGDNEPGYWRRTAKSFALLTGGIYGGDWAQETRDALLEWPDNGPDTAVLATEDLDALLTEAGDFLLVYSTDSLLNEDGSYLLSECHDRIFLEA